MPNEMETAVAGASDETLAAFNQLLQRHGGGVVTKPAPVDPAAAPPVGPRAMPGEYHANIGGAQLTTQEATAGLEALDRHAPATGPLRDQIERLKAGTPLAPGAPELPRQLAAGERMVQQERDLFSAPGNPGDYHVMTGGDPALKAEIETGFHTAGIPAAVGKSLADQMQDASRRVAGLSPEARSAHNADVLAQATKLIGEAGVTRARDVAAKMGEAGKRFATAGGFADVSVLVLLSNISLTQAWRTARGSKT